MTFGRTIESQGVMESTQAPILIGVVAILAALSFYRLALLPYSEDEDVPRRWAWVVGLALLLSLGHAICHTESLGTAIYHSVFLAFLVASTVINHQTWCFPNTLTYPVIVLGAAGWAWLWGNAYGLGGAVGCGIFGLIVRLTSPPLKDGSGERGLGLGTVKMFAAVGAFLGPLFGMIAIFLAFLIATLPAIFTYFANDRRDSLIPMGVFIFLGSSVTLLWQDTVRTTLGL